MNSVWIKDTGILCVAVLLFLSFKFGNTFLFLAILFLIIDIVYPKFFKPIAHFWFLFAKNISNVTGRIFFGLIFFVMIVPIGYLQRLYRGDLRDLFIDKRRKTSFIDRSDELSLGLDKLY